VSFLRWPATVHLASVASADLTASASRPARQKSYVGVPFTEARISRSLGRRSHNTSTALSGSLMVRMQRSIFGRLNRSPSLVASSDRLTVMGCPLQIDVGEPENTSPRRAPVARPTRTRTCPANDTPYGLFHPS